MNTLILGATSSIAEYVARQYAQESGNLILVGRNSEKLERVSAHLRATGVAAIEKVEMELTDITQHAALLRNLFLKYEHIDRVLIAFGWLPDDKVTPDLSTAMEAISVNYAAPVSLLLLLAPYMETQRAGVIGVITSVAGDRGREKGYIYGSNKAGLSVFLQGLRLRLKRSKVKLIDIKPGFVDTPMTAHLKKTKLFASPERVAQGIVKAMNRNWSPVYLPWFWRYIMWIVRHMPEWLLLELKI